MNRDPPKGSFEASFVSSQSKIIVGFLTLEGAKRLLAKDLAAVAQERPDEIHYWKYALQIFDELKDVKDKHKTKKHRTLDTIKFSDFVVVMVELFSTLTKHRAGDLAHISP